VTSDNRFVNTLRLRVDPTRLDSVETRQAIGRAAEILRGGGLVALPTETVYGLGTNALDTEAVARIFAAKQRPAWDPVIVHIAGPVESNATLAGLVAEVPGRARKLMAAFWPGPLTLLLPRSLAVPDAVTAGRPLVGIRMPAHPVAFELIRAAGVPVAAPSANIFGHTSPTTAAHVLDDLDGRIDAILDAGPTDHGLESTVLDPTRSPMIIYRPGAITLEQIREVAGPVELFQSPIPLEATPREALPSPGVGMRHYAPRAQLILIEAGSAGSGLAEIRGRLAEAITHHAGKRVGIMLPVEVAADSITGPGIATYPWGSWAAQEELAHNLYAGLRELDAQGCTLILCPLPSGDGIGAALRDRLRKAADQGGSSQ
jgi:L-threonylcarbamoyladenylate synthase